MKRAVPGALAVLLAAACSHHADHAAPVAASSANSVAIIPIAQAAGSQSGDIPPANISSCNPQQQDVPAKLPPAAGDQLPLFDSYSWRAFAALICDGTKGQKDTAGPITGDGPRVFETWKSAWEIFHPGPISPDFDKREDSRYDPCGAQVKDGELVIASSTKFVDLDEPGGPGVSLGPLPAQNRTYVRYLAQFDKESFTYLRNVLTRNITSGIDFPAGSISVKSAWVEMKNLDSSRFYTRKAWIRTSPNSCTQTTVGLIALHIVHKTRTNKRWIWSTFEHVDNVPDDPGPACQPPVPAFTFHDTSCTPMPDPSMLPHNDPFAPPVGVFNVVRTGAFISTLTQEANDAYHAILPPSVWKNYRLVMTQWGVGQPPSADQGGNPDYTFPGTGSNSAFANPVMETFFQTRVSLSCLGCHGETAVQSDYVWALQIERPQTRSAALGQLTGKLRSSGIRTQ